MTYTPPIEPSWNAPIWRYMDLPKFVSMLSTSSLFFPTLATLRKIDPLEGLFPKEYLRNAYDSDYEGVRVLSEAEHEEKREMHRRGLNDSRYVIQCWHTNEDESQAMWKIYGVQSQNIAVRSTAKRLKDSMEFLRDFDERDCLGEMALVNYTRYDDSDERWGNPIHALFHKHISLNHERELRVLLKAYEPQAVGLSKKVNLKTLIESVYVSPVSEPFFLDVVKSLLEKYGMSHIEPQQSQLLRLPESL